MGILKKNVTSIKTLRDLWSENLDIGDLFYSNQDS